MHLPTSESPRGFGILSSYIRVYPSSSSPVPSIQFLIEREFLFTMVHQLKLEQIPRRRINISSCGENLFGVDWSLLRKAQKANFAQLVNSDSRHLKSTLSEVSNQQRGLKVWSAITENPALRASHRAFPGAGDDLQAFSASRLFLWGFSSL